MIALDINGKRQNVDVPGETPLLWALRDELGLTGSKFGCGMALCGACTVHVGTAGPPASRRFVGDQQEDRHHRGGRCDPIGKALQAAWVDVGVPQCGYCQSGRSCRRPRCSSAHRSPPTPRSTRP